MDIKLFTDGSCLGNPGPGGWALVLRAGTEEIRHDGGNPYTTNNRMELTAVIEGLKLVDKKFKKPDLITIISDSTWVISTMTKNWKRKKNLDLWDALAPLLVGKNIKWQWIKGHAGHRENEDCDVRAVRQAMRQEKIIPPLTEDLSSKKARTLF
ncbi:MAG: ribonuclease H [Candidatus Gracilibacteria bacterium]